MAGRAHYEVLIPLSSCLMAVGQDARAAQVQRGPARPAPLPSAWPCPHTRHHGRGEVLTGACPCLSPKGPTQTPRSERRRPEAKQGSGLCTDSGVTTKFLWVLDSLLSQPVH